MFGDLEGQIEKIYMDAIELVYYMRGSIGLSEVLEMVTIEKNLTIKWLNKHLEREMNKPHPIY
jgi:hypothetical protein